MVSKFEHMAMMQSMCELELLQLQKNLSNFSIKSALMVEFVNNAYAKKDTEMGSLPEECELKGNAASKLHILMAYDKYMSQVGAIVNLARKMNIEMQLTGLSKVLNDDAALETDEDEIIDKFINYNTNDCIDFNKSLSQKTCHQNLVHNVVPPAKEKSLRSVNFTEKAEATVVSCQTALSNIRIRDLSEYTDGCVFSATVTYIENYKKCLFYVLETYDKELDKLSTISVLKPLTTPKQNEIFGVSINDQSVLRATLEPGACDVVRSYDFGDKIILDDNCKLYKLPVKYEIMPTSLIKCKLLGIHGSSEYDNEQNYLAAVLQRNEFKYVKFIVIEKKENVLHVKIHEDRTEKAFSPPKSELSCTKLPPSSPCHKVDKEKTITNIVRMQSFAAIEAKNNCKDFAHIEEGNIVSLTVTHVESGTVFYAYIENGCLETNILSLLSWRDDQLMTKQKLQSPPYIGELVLAQYRNDKFWYRAKVMNVDEQNELFQVFYVDFGNTESVTLNSLARCPLSEIAEPFRALRCRLNDIYDVTGADDVLSQQAIETLLVIILHQTFTVKIMKKTTKELLVRITDGEFADVPTILVRSGYAKEK